MSKMGLSGRRIRVGETTLLHFTVSDGEALYEIACNPADQNWMLHGQQAVQP